MWLPELVAGVPGSEEEVVVTTNGRSALILTNVDDYGKETPDMLSDPALMKQISRTQHSIDPGGEACRVKMSLVSRSLPLKKRRRI
jgi:PHD/YefM family antitoxin component YafN of YafNO toxin-antitoxin module